MASSTTSAISTHDQLVRARRACSQLAQFSSEQKNSILLAMADELERNVNDILAANRADLEACGLSGPMLDRLSLNPERVSAMAEGIREVVQLPDPVYERLAEWVRPNGLVIRKVRVPLGVVGIIYESRPNVTADTAALAIKTGNAIVLRGGKEAVRSNQCLVEILNRAGGLP